MRATMTTLRGLGLAALILLAFSGPTADAAVKGHTWEFNGALLGGGQSESCKATSDGTMTLAGKVLGKELHITSTSISATGCRLIQSHSGAEAIAEGTIEQLSLSGLTVDKPTECSVGSPITLNAVKSLVITSGTVAYTTYVPESGNTLTNITLSGNECSVKGTYALNGSVCAEMQQAGSLKFEQRLNFSEAADKACPADTLTLGGESASLRNSFVLDPTGPGEGKVWGFTATADPPHVWEVNGAKLVSGASETCKATSDGTMTFKSSVLSEEVDFTATAVGFSGCKITQNGSGSEARAEGTIEKISFSGLSFDKPTGCKVSSPINTVAMKTKIITTVAPVVAYTTLSPEIGTTWSNVTITECAIAETYPLKGSVCAEMPQVGKLAVEQTIKFSEVADKACPTDMLAFVGGPTILRGGIIPELSGANTGKSWGFTAS